MADTVQLVLERMIPELEDLQARGIFSDVEVKSIIQRRREFEYLFVKRAAQEDDYLRALQYELTLEALRRKRRERLGLQRTSLSDHSGVRRMHFIFDRACRKFRGDIRWWLQWLDFALRTNSAKAVGKILARALQLHPRSEELWLQAAEFEFDRQRNVTAARALLLRALRLNKGSRRLWLAYFRLECLYVLTIRGRRAVLGLDAGRGWARATGTSAGLLESGAVEAGVGPVPSSQADEEEGGRMEEDEEGGAGEGEGGEGGSGAAPSVAAVAGVVDAAAAAGVPAPGTEGGSAGSALPPAFLADTDARDAFFAGSVPRIVYEQASSLFPCDFALRSQFLDAADSFQEEGASAAAPSPPAFPALCTHILGSIAGEFGEQAEAWELLATRPARGLGAAAALRATARAVEASGAVRASRAGAIEGAEDGDLFVLDKGRAGPGEEEEEKTGEEEGEEEGGEEEGKGAGAAAAVTSLPTHSSWLSSGACDGSLLQGLPDMGDAWPTLPFLPSYAPVWSADGAAQAAVASPPAAGRKRARVEAPTAGAGLALLCPSAVSPLPAPDAALEAWAADAGKQGQELLAEAVQGAAADPARLLALLAVNARMLVATASLPLVPSRERSERVQHALVALHAVCARALPLALAAGTAGTGAVSRALALNLGLLRLQAELRLGRVTDAVATAAELEAALPLEAVPALVAARLSSALLALPAAATTAAPPTVVAAGGVSLPSSPTVSLDKLTGWRSGPSAPAPPSTLLRAALKRPLPGKEGISALLCALLRAEFVRAGVQAACSVVQGVELAGLSPDQDGRVRALYVDLVVGAGGGVEHLTAALAPCASAASTETVLRAATVAWVRSGSPAASLPKLRSAFDSSLSRHGKVSAGLWAAYLALERGVGLGGGRASSVYDRALRALEGEGRQAFAEAAVAP